MIENLEEKPIRISSKLTKFSKVMLIVLGIPIALTIPLQTAYAPWAILLGIVLVMFCVYFSKTASDAFLQHGKIEFEGLFGRKIHIGLNEISAIKRFKNRKHEYFFFRTPAGSYWVIAPLWGDGRAALLALFDKFKST